jgi:hypothetical protein
MIDGSTAAKKLGELIAESSSLPKNCELSAQPPAFIQVYAISTYVCAFIQILADTQSFKKKL